MPVVVPLLLISVARRQREQGRARGNWNRYPLRRPNHAFPILTATFLFTPSVIYLIEVHRHLPLRWANHRRKAQEKGMTVEQFREWESKEIEGFSLPYTRFFARDNWSRSVRGLSFGSKRARSVRD